METASKIWAEIQRLGAAFGRFFSRWLVAMISGTWQLLRPIVCPFAVARDRILHRVGGIIAERLTVIRDEWREDIEGVNNYPDYAAARQRARVREVNAILAQIQREFPSFEPEIAVDPFDMQNEVHEDINARREITPITAPRIVGKAVRMAGG